MPVPLHTRPIVAAGLGRASHESRSESIWQDQLGYNVRVEDRCLDVPGAFHLKE
jgi:hypothetical protein